MFKQPKPLALKGLLAERGISQSQVAFSLGISQGGLSQVLTGWKKPTKRLQEALDKIWEELSGKKAA